MQAWKHGCISAPKPLWYVTIYMAHWSSSRKGQKQVNCDAKQLKEGKKNAPNVLQFLFSIQLCALLSKAATIETNLPLKCYLGTLMSLTTKTGWEEFIKSQTECRSTYLQEVLLNCIKQIFRQLNHVTKKIMNFKQATVKEFSSNITLIAIYMQM